MWRWLLIPILFSHLSFAAPTSSGPVSNEEAVTLWREGEAAFAANRYEDANIYLRRYVDRYPGKPNYLKAHQLLGKSLVELGKPKEALPFLKNSLTRNLSLPETIRSRLWIAEAQLELKKYHEAYLSTVEASSEATRETSQQAKPNTKNASTDLILESDILKARALLGMKRIDQATDLMTKAEAALTPQIRPAVRGNLYRFKLKLKTLNCAELPTRERLTERQVQDQLDRRGTCLLEALLIYRDVLRTAYRPVMNQAWYEIFDSYQSYKKICAGPFSLPPGYETQNASQSSEERTLQAKRYQTELADHMKNECRTKFVTAVELLKTWKTDQSLSHLFRSGPTNELNILQISTSSIEKLAEVP